MVSEITGEVLFSRVFCSYVAENLSSLESAAQLLHLRNLNASEDKKLHRSLLLRYTESYPICADCVIVVIIVIVVVVIGGSF